MRVTSQNPDVMSGALVFAGTRVPVETLIDYLKAGESIDRFLEGFPTVTREQVVAVLEEAKKMLVNSTVLAGDWTWKADEAGHLQFRECSNE